MALDLDALHAALPAAIVAAVAGAPAGLVDAAQVVFGRTKPQPAGDVSGWIRPLDPEPLEPGLGHTRSAFPFEVTLEKTGGTLADLTGWRDALTVYFRGYKRPNVTGLWASTINTPTTDLHPGEGPAVALRAVIRCEEL